MGVDFKNVPFGYLRPELARRSVGRSASRRRGNMSQRGNLTLEQQATADASENKNSFPAIVLRSRFTTHKRGSDRVAMLSAESAESQYKNYIYNVYYHGNAAFPAPDSLEDPRIPTYPEATLDSSALSSVSGLGNANNNYDLTSRLVIIEFEDPERRLNARIKSVGKYTDLPLFESKLSETFAGGALGGGGGTAPGAASTGAKVNNLVFTLKRDEAGPPLPVGNSTQRVTGEDIGANIATIVQTEFDFWKDRKETSGDMDGDGVNETDERIHKYNDFVMQEVSHIKKGGSYFHWSAVFVSWVINQVTPFPKFSAHTFYARAAKKGESGWTLWMTETAGSGPTADPDGLHAEHKIQANLGDVLVQPPTGTRLTAGKGHESHADVVYKIEDGEAHLAGGNLSNTAKSPGWLPVDADGNYSGYATKSRASNPYQLIIKKNGNLVNIATS